MQKFRTDAHFYAGIICGAWVTYLAPLMGSTELATASILTAAIIVLLIWDYRKARRTGASGSIAPPTRNAE